MQVTLSLETEVARALQRQQPATPASTDLAQTIQRLGVMLEPMYPGESLPYLQSYFSIKVADATAARRVIEGLQNCRGVEAIYVKPAGEAPAH